jgi:hypothetical protein
MTARQIADRLRQNLNEYLSNEEKETARIAQDLLTQIKLRIQTSGKNSQGAAFVGYVPSYAKYRQKKGAQTGFVDLTMTGRLWANVKVETVQSEGKTAFIIGPTNSENTAKLLGQLEKRGNVLIPTSDEITIALEANLERLRKLFQL